MNSATFQKTYELARQRPAAEQEVVAIYMQHALENKPVSLDDAATLRGLGQAMRGEGYTEEEARGRMAERIASRTA